MSGENLLDYLIVGAIGAVCMVLLVRHFMRALGGGEASKGCSCCSERKDCDDQVKRSSS